MARQARSAQRAYLDGNKTTYLHVLDAQTLKRKRSFLSPSPRGPIARVFQSVGFAAVAAGPTGLAATISVYDSVYFFSSDGTMTGARGLGLRHFQDLPKSIPGSRSMSAMQSWLRGLSQIHGIYEAGAGRYLVNYAIASGVVPTQQRWALALISVGDSVNTVFDVANTPKVYGVASDLRPLVIYVQSTVHEEANRWVRYRLRD